MTAIVAHEGSVDTVQLRKAVWLQQPSWFYRRLQTHPRPTRSLASRWPAARPVTVGSIVCCAAPEIVRAPPACEARCRAGLWGPPRRRCGSRGRPGRHRRRGRRAGAGYDLFQSGSRRHSSSSASSLATCLGQVVGLALAAHPRADRMVVELRGGGDGEVAVLVVEGLCVGLTALLGFGVLRPDHAEHVSSDTRARRSAPLASSCRWGRGGRAGGETLWRRSASAATRPRAGSAFASRSTWE